MGSKVYEMPDAVDVDGINLPAPWFRPAINGNVDDVVLDKNTDVLIATFPRTGRLKH